MARASIRDEDPPARNVSDPFHDLLSVLADGPRQGFVQRLATGFYEGWRPTRAQVANLIARETGRITEDEYLSALRGIVAVPDSGHMQSINGSHLSIPAERSPTGSVVPRSALTAGSGRAQIDPSKLPAFTVPCAELLPHWDFIARGLIGGAWVKRGGKTFRLMSLQYELIPRQRLLAEPEHPTVFAALITCLPDSPAPREPADGTSGSHLFRAGRVLGVRGHWPISPDVRRIRFLIYPQQPPNDESERHPAGALWVDLTNGEAHWRQITDRYADRYVGTTRQQILREG